MHRERDVQRALRVVLVGCGSAERGHHCIADELLHRSARALDLRGHRVVETVEQRACALRVFISRQLGGADEIGEQDGR